MSNWKHQTINSVIQKTSDCVNQNIKIRTSLLSCKTRLSEVGFFSGLNLAREIDLLAIEANRIYELTECINEIIEEDLGQNPQIPPHLKERFKELKAVIKKNNQLVQSNLDRAKAIKGALVSKSIVVYLVNACGNLVSTIKRSFLKVIRFTVVTSSKLLPKRQSRKSLPEGNRHNYYNRGYSN